MWKPFLPFLLLVGVVVVIGLPLGTELLTVELGSVMPLSSFDKDVIITEEQRKILKEFKSKVESKLPHDWMKEDLYLVRWLRAKEFNIKDAQEMLMESLVWRNENRIDGIQKENWSAFEKTYPYHINLVDKEGKPMLYFHPGAWDLRKVAITNDAKRFSRYMDRAIDSAFWKVRDLQLRNKNVTQGTMLVNLAGYNVVQHACLQCIPIILRGILTYEKYYPGLAEKVIMVNTPAAFEPLLQTIKGVLSPPTKAALKIYGMNKREWRPFLHKYFSKDQLPVEMGGTFIADDVDY